MTTDTDQLRIATFDADATPAIGDPIMYGTVEAIDDPLSCRGVAMFGAGAPIVLAAIDWIGTYNGGHDMWRAALADAVGTAPERVVMHAVHQHEAPMFDADAETALLAHGLDGAGIDAQFARETIRRAAGALREAASDPIPVSHVGIGTAEVEGVASNRQLLGPDGECIHFRASSESDPRWRDAPEGLIDPRLGMVSFWNDADPVAALSYYATHPQSYYRNGRVTCDFPGLARNRHETETGVFRLHFTGAAGNVAAGKYNDGTEARRPVLADRVFDGMTAAWADTERRPMTASDVDLDIARVSLPLAARDDTAGVELTSRALSTALGTEPSRRVARVLAWCRRRELGHETQIPCLHLPGTDIVHLPGEPFVEYQLAAQRMRPDRTVLTAGYGDGGPLYIGTEAAYTKGGYEVGTSLVAPTVEGELTDAIRNLLDAHESTVEPSDLTGEKPTIEE